MKFNLLLLFITFIISIVIINPKDIIDNKEYIYLDPGHGGFDGGTSKDGLLEKDLVLDISYLIKDNLELYGYNVLLTRSKDCALGNTKKEDIYNRVSLINKDNVILFISIHANSFPSSIVRGAQVFYKNDSNKEIAELIQSYLSLVDSTKRVAKSIDNKYLLDHVTKPGCLIEVGFLSNIIDLNNLKDLNYLLKLSKYISIAIIDYLSKEGE